jgi:hypothetical protein
LKWQNIDAEPFACRGQEVFDAIADAGVNFKGCLAWRGSRTRAKISGRASIYFCDVQSQGRPDNYSRLKKST